MRTETVKFERVTNTATRSVPCPVCGKKRRVQRTFGQTVNPFHPAVRDFPPDASYHEMRAAVRRCVDAEAAEWTPSPREAAHEACEGAA